MNDTDDISLSVGGLSAGAAQDAAALRLLQKFFEQQPTDPTLQASPPRGAVATELPDGTMRIEIPHESNQPKNDGLVARTAKDIGLGVVDLAPVLRTPG